MESAYLSSVYASACFCVRNGLTTSEVVESLESLISVKKDRKEILETSFSRIEDILEARKEGVIHEKAFQFYMSVYKAMIEYASR